MQLLETAFIQKRVVALCEIAFAFIIGLPHDVQGTFWFMKLYMISMIVIVSITCS